MFGGGDWEEGGAGGGALAVQMLAGEETGRRKQAVLILFTKGTITLLRFSCFSPFREKVHPPCVQQSSQRSAVASDVSPDLTPERPCSFPPDSDLAWTSPAFRPPCATGAPADPSASGPAGSLQIERGHQFPVMRATCGSAPKEPDWVSCFCDVWPGILCA